MTNVVLHGWSNARKPHSQIDEGKVTSGKPRRGSLLYRAHKNQNVFGWVTFFGVAFATLSGQAVTNRPIDDAFVVLSLRPEMAGAGGVVSDDATSGCAYNLLDWGGAGSSEKVNMCQFQTAGIPLAYLTNSIFATPVHPMTPAERPYIYLPQSSYLNASDNAWYAARNRLVLGHAASSSRSQTMYCRFRWDGQSVPRYSAHMHIFLSAYDWNHETHKVIDGQTIKSQGSGLTMYIDRKSDSTGYLRIQAFNDQNMPPIEIPTNRWIDAFCTVQPGTADNTNAVVTLHAIITPDSHTSAEGDVYWEKPTMTSTKKTLTKIVDFNNYNYPNVLFGSERASAYVKVPGDGEGSISTFRGAIAEYASWNRILTEREMWLVASGFHGATWAVGAINGKAEEFARSTENVSDVFEVTNAWRNCRRALTSEHPSLTLTGPVQQEWSNMGHLFCITPLFSADAPAVCPVRISVCGNELPDVYDLRKSEGRNIFIKKSYWMRDAAGNVSVTLRREGSPVVGSVSFDALVLTGSWCLGAIDGGTDGVNERRIVSDYWIGDMETSNHKQRCICYEPALNHENVHMYMPPEVCDRDFRYRLDTKVLEMIQELDGHMAIGFYVNDKLVETKRDLRVRDVASVDVPKGFFVPGLNTVVFSNASDGAVGSYINWCNIDYFRLTVRDKPNGAVVIIR